MIAPSFADIFYGNAINNGMVPVRLKEEEVDALFQLVAAQPGIGSKWIWRPTRCVQAASRSASKSTSSAATVAQRAGCHRSDPAA